MRYKLYFELSHQDGTIIDKCWDEVFEFEAGDGQIDPCLERCITGAKVGRLETFLLSPEEGFGQYDDDSVQTMQKTDFDPALTLEEDMAVAFDLPSGKEILGYIKEIQETQVVVDFNHLLAGQYIVFKVEVLSATKRPE